VTGWSVLVQAVISR